jgi:type VI protein secretion system component VasK
LFLDLHSCRRRSGMRVLGIAGLVLALAIAGYLVVSYLHEGTKIQETLQTVPGASGTSQPVDVTRRGLERRLAPTLDQERQRVEETNKAAGQ